MVYYVTAVHPNSNTRMDLAKFALQADAQSHLGRFTGSGRWTSPQVETRPQ